MIVIVVVMSGVGCGTVGAIFYFFWVNYILCEEYEQNCFFCRPSEKSRPIFAFKTFFGVFKYLSRLIDGIRNRPEGKVKEKQC